MEIRHVEESKSPVVVHVRIVGRVGASSHSLAHSLTRSLARGCRREASRTRFIAARSLARHEEKRVVVLLVVVNSCRARPTALITRVC